MPAGGDSRDEDRIDGGNRSVSEDAVRGEAEEFGILAASRLQGGCSTSEQAGGRINRGIRGEVDDNGSM